MRSPGSCGQPAKLRSRSGSLGAYDSDEAAAGGQRDMQRRCRGNGSLLLAGVIAYALSRPDAGAGDSPVAIAYKHVQEWPPRPSQFVTGVPAGLPEWANR